MAMVVRALEEKIDSTKGIRIHIRSWRPASTPRAVVVICHGVNSWMDRGASAAPVT